ncbi:cyclic nucleotide-binding domain-containing protein [Blastomonas sp. UPD001]|uniref:cyclic nucleotide-binding domain-containing protein n=1 Tax=Blastomonas sp. UPD001 TaxID=2217673 RepID=UPI000E356B67|nr:cyclic nucleotide-binding domain-containing protein [Blastomonas sp. UPD001]
MTDKSDPGPRHDEMFLVFDAGTMARIAAFSGSRILEGGETLFTTGDREIGLIAVLSGRVAVRQHDGAGRSSLVAEDRPGSLWGEINGLSSRLALVGADMLEAGEVSILSTDQARALLVAEAALREGASVIAQIHAYLAQTAPPSARM